MRINSRTKKTDLAMLTNRSTLKQQTVPCSLFPVPYSLYLALSFLLPFTIMGTAFALNGVYPFGSRQILNGDLFHQGYSILSNFWHKLREGGISSWSWAGGGGHDYAALISYYLTSPLNLLAFMFPYSFLREALTLIMLVKIGCAGLFAAIFFNHAFRLSDHKIKPAGLIIWSCLYALCAFTLGYYLLVFWFDSFALMPLVMLGLLSLLKEGKWRDPKSGRFLYRSRLFIFSLALVVFSNFYISIFICIFTVITFFGYCFIQKLTRREFLRKLGLTAACSTLAICMAAIVLIPSWSALQNTYAEVNSFPSKLVLYNSFIDILGNFIAFTPPTFYDGLPNLYCGMISIMLSGLFFFSKKISRREKAFFGGVLVFLLLSCNLNILDYIMHGFRYPIFLPSRFSFLISFIVVIIAFRGYLLTETLGKHKLIVMGISALVFLMAAALGSQDKNAVIGSAVLCVFYLFLVQFFKNGKSKISLPVQRMLKLLLFLVIITELSVSAWIGVKTVNTTSRDVFNEEYHHINTLLSKREMKSDISSRTDIEFGRNYNTSLLHNYNGISFFSSTLSEGVLKFMQGLGLHASPVSNSIWYCDSTPLTNTILSLRYVIIPEYSSENSLPYWDIIFESGGLKLMKNNRYLPLGFMVKKNIALYTHNINPFLSQNDFFHRATGLDEDLFTRSDQTLLSSHDYNGLMMTNYKIPSDGLLYAICVTTDVNEKMDIYINGNFFHQIDFQQPEVPFIFPVGNFSQNDVVSLITERDAFLVLSHFNSRLFEQGYSLLARQPLVITKFKDTQVCGTVNVLEDGLLYTSIPADKNWSVYVNGVKDKIVLIDNAMIAVRLGKGTHQIEFRYFNTSLVIGIAVSLVSIAVFVVLVLWKKGKWQGKREKRLG